MGERRKRLTVLTVIFALAGGCGNKAEQTQIAETVISTEAAEMETTSQVETQQTVLPPSETETVVEETTEEQAEEAGNSALSGDGTDLQFVLDGKTYQLPFAYRELEEMGWTIDLEDLDEGERILNPGEETFGGILLEHPVYDDWDVTMYVKLKNHSDTALDILESDIYYLRIEIDKYKPDFAEAYPQMTISNGLSFGSSLSEVEEVFKVGNSNDDDYYSYSWRGEEVTLYCNTAWYHDLVIKVVQGRGIVSFTLEKGEPELIME